MTEFIRRGDVYNLILGGHLKSAGSRKKAEEWLNIVPSVNVMPIVYAKWLDVDDDMTGINYRCSNCRRTTYTAKQYDLKGNEYVYKYCPHCAARMDVKYKT